MSGRLLIVGDALLDRDVEGRSERLCSDAPVPVLDQLASRTRPGGAGLAALLAARAGIATTLVTALAPDAAGAELARALLGVGVELIDLGLEGATPEKVRILDRGRPSMRLDRGGGAARPEPSAGIALAGAIRLADGILVSDYGNGVAALPWVRAALSARPALTPLVWDPHPRGPAPIPGSTLVTPNRDEAATLDRDGDRAGRSVSSARAWHGSGPIVPGAGRVSPSRSQSVGDAAMTATRLRAEWDAEAVVVTCGGDGAALAIGWGPESRRAGAAVPPPDETFVVPVEPVDGDPCGAGDRFAVEAAWILACGGDAAVACWLAAATATCFVAEGGARAIDSSAPDPRRAEVAADLGAAPLSIEPALRLAERTRRAGGTVVATGGCFDLLHAGHLRTLRAARELGDCLVVLLNGDRSVRRLKGPDRPLVGELERAELLAALDPVDEVAIFDEETPVEALSLLRPDVWVKGGDYAPEALPEREALAGWGGRVVLLPFLAGRSTTRLIEKVGQHG